MSECPCGSQKNYDSCCQVFINGQSQTTTAEETMRARYSAFVKGEVDFIVGSHHPDHREEVNREEIQTWSNSSDWKGLEIVETLDGGSSDSSGKVEFIARYAMEGKTQNHHEVADFQKVDGKWYFVDGQMIGGQIVRSAPKVGRNDPCPCGSGKKFKKCCG